MQTPFYKSLLNIIFLAVALSTCSACYTLSGIAIDPNTKTFYVSRFENTSSSVVTTLSTDFTEALKNKIRAESRLNFKDTEPDIEFSGSITEYRVKALAPEPGETTSFNRLTMAVSVEFKNNKDEKNTWKKSFSFFQDFESSQNLISIQDDLIEVLNDNIVDQIFNHAFTNW